MSSVFGVLLVFFGFLFAMAPGYLFSLPSDPAPWVYIFTVVFCFASAVRLLEDGINLLAPPQEADHDR